MQILRGHQLFPFDTWTAFGIWKNHETLFEHEKRQLFTPRTATTVETCSGRPVARECWSQQSDKGSTLTTSHFSGVQDTHVVIYQISSQVVYPILVDLNQHFITKTSTIMWNTFFTKERSGFQVCRLLAKQLRTLDCEIFSSRCQIRRRIRPLRFPALETAEQIGRPCQSAHGEMMRQGGAELCNVRGGKFFCGETCCKLELVRDAP